MIEHMIHMLETNVTAILGSFEGASIESVRWKPAPDKWSLLEILNHLGDEERDDFRRRIRLLLADPQQDWPPIDPDLWAIEREYNSRDLAKSLRDFAAERQASIDWLRSLESPDWKATKTHPLAGSLMAGDLLASWVAHDLMHLGQIARTKLALAREKAKPFSTDYASP